MSEYADRRQWFEEYTSRIGQGVIKESQPGVRYPCPCCGYPTLDERGGYDICQMCGWEDDGQDDPHADEVWGGPNGGYSLSSARRNFRLHLSKYSQDERNTKDSATEIQAKRAMIKAFDSMVNETRQAVLDTLWQRVHDNEQILEQELYRRVRELEAQMRAKDEP